MTRKTGSSGQESGPDHSFDEVLKKIRKESKNKTELGSRFERLIKDFFETDTHYRNRFSKVYLWMKWPKRDGPDTGIDLVAEQYNGELCAIQCKCYDDDGNLEKKQVDKFLAKAAGLNMEHKILAYTGDTITNNADRSLKQNKCHIITQAHLRESSVDWSEFPKITSKDPKKLRPHQNNAVDDVLKGMKKHDRGKLIMACGTGKTLASLHIAERQVGRGGMVLYLVPSISLILQSMREWSENANMRHYYLIVCSDKSTGEDASITELESPVSTDEKKLVPYIKSRPKDAMTVIFSTYHSIDVVKKAISKQAFDLILCDEAHRTTGVEDKSFFTFVHKNSNIHGKKRLYMTATPRVYSDVIKAKLGKIIYSMDDVEKYGPDFHKLSFTEAVKQDILSDFKVKIAIAPADKVDKDWKELSYKEKGEMPLDERTLLAAVWHGITHPDDNKNPKLLQRVIAFANRIDRSMMFAGQITDGQDIDRSFEGVVEQYEKKNRTGYAVKIDHIDGKTKALHRRNKMRWLDDSTKAPNTCRILSNAKCLSEGVDVPALDGVIFLNPRKSRVDVVQSVGRVMRKSKNKSFGYVILPVALPAGIEYHEALNDNKTFKVVWQVLNALRSHDEDFGNEINRLILDKNTESTGTPRISVSVLDDNFETDPYTKFFDKIKSKIVEKVGDINYYDKYGKRIGRTVHTIDARIKNKMKLEETSNLEIKNVHNNLKKMINDSVTEKDTIQVIAQHMVLSKVFNALFQGKFTSQNPISLEFDRITKKIKLDEELTELKGFYMDVKHELKHITSREARQSFIKKLYGNFFESVDKKGTEQHGIVYTPVEIIDFIIHSTEFLLQKHFNVGFNDRFVKVLEPFAGTGTFITRLLESGLITNNLYEKYKNDLYANELILLAYYIASVNIETTYSSLRNRSKYVPFEGISYTDTLNINALYREDERHRKEIVKFGNTFKSAHERIRNQRGSHVHVILGNPPYSAGQSDYTDHTQNISYPELDGRIKDTYVEKSKAQRKASLYDSYIRALRWASDRLGKSGIISFITNASFIRSDVADGVRASFKEEFTEIWCFDLRGNGRITGDGRNIFEYTGQSSGGTRTPVAIIILVKNPKKREHKILYSSLDKKYYSGQNKRDRVKQLGSIQGINDWKEIKPDMHHDWINKRRNDFSRYNPMGKKESSSQKNTSNPKSQIKKIRAGKSNMNKNVIFQIYSGGVASSRDAWVYNTSKSELEKNMRQHIDYCNSQNLDDPNLESKIDPKCGKWGRGLSKKIKKLKPKFEEKNMRISLFRPFFKQWLYFDPTRTFNGEVYQMPKLFPEKYSENLVIIVPYKFTGEFSTYVTNITPDSELVHHGQCFPFYIYENKKVKKPNITDYALKDYQSYYNDKKITKKDIFYYIYGLLHHSVYKKKFANNLMKELPHIPMAPNFWVFSNAGEKLIDLHLNFDTCKQFPLGKPKCSITKFTKMSFPKKKIKQNNKTKTIDDKTVIRIDGLVAFDNIPEMQYKINGRTPTEWLVDKYKISVDKDSGIKNDPNINVDPISLIKRAIYVGTESDKIISELSKEEFEPQNWKPKKKWFG